MFHHEMPKCRWSLPTELLHGMGEAKFWAQRQIATTLPQPLTMCFCTGSMIESRLICCQNSADFDMWIRHLQHQIKMANAHCPTSPDNNISFLVSQWRTGVKRMAQKEETAVALKMYRVWGGSLGDRLEINSRFT